ncbi:MAG TPA: sigma-70 family RNA polymerase sigma factor [Puia sp.]|jgi:RNA polymerase sigma-70 factor (ECF subfamily)|nr:sigma-70 family RNA polymerase sigma factor [Puia sp.]
MDTALIISLQNGSEESFKEVYYGYHKKLYFYFLKKTGSTSLSKDLIQETFIKLWRYRLTLRTDLSVSLQLFRIARTVAIDLLRRNARNRVDSVSTAHIIELSDGLHESPETEASPVITKIRSSLSLLPPVRRKIIEQKLEGYSNPEIASNLSISQKTVENHLNKAFHQLKKHLVIPVFLILLFFFQD